MKSAQQATIKTPASIQGKGLHTGKPVRVEVLPADPNTGIRFQRIDLPNAPILEASCKLTNQTQRATVLEKNGARLSTVEHFMAACVGLGISNLLVKVDNEEMPILDGSSAGFVRMLLEAERVEQAAELPVFAPTQVIRVQEGDSYIEILPADSWEATVLVDYNSKVLPAQFSKLANLADFQTEIASARTFVFLHEIAPLLEAGLVKGGDLDSAVVFVEQLPSADYIAKLAQKLEIPDLALDQAGVLNLTKLRFSNEPARHKLLDLIGDLGLTGIQLQAKIIGFKTGHRINQLAGLAILKAYEQAKKNAKIPVYDPNQTPFLDTIQIQQKLQHRYPFLLLDKIMSISDKEIIGVKNVTIDEPFFQGHFPNNPIMPGVLQIEAMAQVGGIFMFHQSQIEDTENWDTYFLRIQNARFRYKVLPGDTLVLHLTLLSPLRRGLCEMQAKAYVGTRLVAEAELLAQILKRGA